MKNIFAILLLLSGVAFGQASISGTISASASDCNTTNACVSLNLPINTAAISVTVNGTFSGTLQFENTGDGSTFVAVLGSPQPSGTSVSSTTSTGVWVFAVASMTDFRVRASAMASGSASVTIKSSLATPTGDSSTAITAALPAGTNVIGKVGIDQATPGTTNGVQVSAALPAGSNTIGAVTQSSGPWTINVTQLANSILGAPANYGTSPGAVLVPGVNAFITNTHAVTQSGGPWSQNITQVAGQTLGAISNYGTSPGAVLVPAVNAFVTNTQTFSGALTNNNAAPATTNLGVLPAIANAANPSYTEGNQVLSSVDLTGRGRVRGTATNNNAAPAADQIDVMPNVANAASPTWAEGNSTKDSVDLAGRKRTFNPDLTPGTCTITASGTANGCTVTMSGYAGAGFIVTAGGAGTATLAPYIVGPDCSTIRTTATQMMDVTNGTASSNVANPATGKVYLLLGPVAGDCKVGVYASSFTANITVQLRATTIPSIGQGFNLNGGTWTPWPLYTNAPSTVNGQPFWQSYVDPCAAPGVLKSHKFANITTATTTSIIAVSGSTNIYVCGIDVQLNSTTSSTILFEHGTGAACTGTTSDTATYSNGGLTSETMHMGFGGSTYYATGASQGLCAVTTVGTSPTIAVDITYVQQ